MLELPFRSIFKTEGQHLAIARQSDLFALPSFEVPFGSCRGASLAFRLLFILGSGSWSYHTYFL